jgi:protein-S-isoprenylcysteine O-methyltransferase Ste14
MYSYWQLFAAWFIYFTIHSIWASSMFKQWVSKYMPWLKSWYRIIYNLFAIILLIPVIWIHKHLLHNSTFFEPSFFLKTIGYIGILIGLYLGKAGFKSYSMNEFSGFYQLKNHHEFHPTVLNTSGLNGVVRHPLYFAGIVIIWSYFLVSPRPNILISNLCITGYLYIGSLFEEKKLIADFGEVYTQYKKEVSMLIPVKWILKRLNF